MELEDKIAVVTGAGGAIGRAVVARLVHAGARVVLVDRDADALAAVERAHAASTTSVAVDLADPDATRAAAAAVLDAEGRVDILVNGAGILSNDKLMETRLADWHRLMAINLDAALLLSQAFVPTMAQNGFGRVVNIASFAWKSGGLTAGTAYSVSKAALVGLTFSTAREFAATGVTANAIAPAYVISPMVMRQLTEAQREKQLAGIPVGRFCAPEEVAHTVGFLASPLAGFITGEVIDMNGGMQFD